ncbi:MAG: ATPase domain-containing protein [Euryarchaeota archaeon]|nr:ATPase domain-containing protein [Euryarchaeota archaeon]
MTLRPTGIAGLDEILGGFPKPSTILIAGTAGVGKTMFVLESLSSVAEQESTLYIPITTSRRSFKQATSPFMHESITVHPIERLSVERDPLSVLIDIENVVATSHADRIAIDPITPLGSAFSEQERHRFIGTIDSMTREWEAITLFTGELTSKEIHTSIISHFVDEILYLSYEDHKRYISRNLRIFKTMSAANDHIPSKIYTFNISKDGIRVFPNLENEITHTNTSTRIPTGIPRLDAMTEGGIPETYSTLVTGSSGTGKTIFGLEFIHESLKNDKPAVVVSFNELPEQLIAEALRFGWDLRRYVVDGILKFVHTTDQVHPDEHLWRVRDAVESIGARSVLFDGISDMETVFYGSVRVENYIHSLIGYFKHASVTSVFTNGTEYAAASRITDVGTSFLMDGIISLDNTMNVGEMKKTLRIVKLRGTNHSRAIHEYSITDHGIEILGDEN